ncbi:MAG: outer membrane protein assembly factor BamA [Deltaproteobacteria bacterium]|nr:outer membrane protein assembly factor BamA [Deltaproteobacteria bacterium]
MMKRFLLLLLLILPSPLSQAEPIVTRVILDLFAKDHTEEEIRSILPLEEGDPYSAEKLEEARDKLIKMGLFEAVKVSAHPTGGGIEIRYSLSEALLVRKVFISGNYPYLGKKIVRLSYIQEGSPFREDWASQSEERIREFFEKEGYYGTTVDLIAKVDKKYRAVNLRIKIKKGKPLPVGEVTVAGNKFFSDDRVRDRLFGFHKFKLRKLTRRIKRLEQKYVDKGFVRARVKLVSVVLNPETNRVDVEVDIKERKKLKAFFEGNGWFEDDTLKHHTVFKRERSYDRIAVERSIARLKSFYSINGFSQTSIKAHADETEEEIIVTFFVKEGVRTRLKNIDIHGNKAFSDRKLANKMELETQTPFRQGFFKSELVDTDLERIEAYYHDRGFFDAEVTGSYVELNSFGDQAVLHITVDEKAPSIVHHFIFEGNFLFSEKQLLKRGGLKGGKRYDLGKINRARGRIISSYHEKGYPYTEVVPKNVPRDDGMDIVLEIDEKARVTIDRIIVSGNFMTKESYIRDTLKIKPGDIYTYKKTLDAQLNLRRLGIFDHARVAPVGLDEERDRVDLLVFVQERKSLTLDIQAGYDTDKQGSAEALLTKRNLFGTAKQIQVRGIGGFELSRGELTFFAPRIYGARWNLVNQYFFQYEDDENFNARSYGASLGTLKNFGPDWSILLKEQFTRFDIFESESNRTALATNLFDSSFSELTTSAAYDSRDNYSDPQSGVFGILSSELNTDLADVSNNFDIAKLSLSHYEGFAGRFTLINSLRVGKLFRISNASRIPATKLFFMGGNDTVRGFEEDTINESGGTTSVIYNSELHYRLFNGVKIAGFFDAGSLTEEFTEMSGDTFRESAGVGFRYFTPVGPIRADWAFILDRRPGEPLQRFHLSFGYFF